MGVTDYRVSVDTGIPKSTFADWKSGRSNPKLEKLKTLADYFKVSIEYFIEYRRKQIWKKEGNEKQKNKTIWMSKRIISHSFERRNGVKR